MNVTKVTFSGEVKVKGTKVKMMKCPDPARAESHYLSFA